VSSIFLITNENETANKLKSMLSSRGFTVSTATTKEKMVERIVQDSPELILLEMNGQSGQSLLHELTHGSRIKTRVPIMALVTTDNLNWPDEYLGMDDFVVWPYDDRELVFRARRLIQRNKHLEEMIYCGDLVIDQANCEVRVKGKVVELTFKEYELLKFMTKDKGRVFTREALLNKVWGYDYFGGDRTVDVHIRRLRSKIEDSGQTFIETVRNIGYRFKKDKC
jgi:two-component system alkaline phosphatase synthesis response regulator PhoP